MKRLARSCDECPVRPGTEIGLYVCLGLLLALLALSPLASAVREVIKLEAPWQQVLSLDSRTLLLLSRTLALAFSAAAASTFFGTILALTMRFWPRCHNPVFAGLLLAFPIPAYVHTAGWSLALQSVGASWHGILAAWWCTVMSFIPLSVLAAYAILESLDEELIQAAALVADGPRCLTQVLLPLSLPLLVVAVLLVFCLNLMDYTIPSLCQVNVYPLRIFADFSLHAHPGRSLLLSSPLLVIGLPLFFLVAQGLKRVGTTMKPRGGSELKLEWPFYCSLAAGLALAVFAAELGVPLVSLFKEASKAKVMQHLVQILPALTYSFGVAVAAALLSSILAYPAGVLLAERPFWSQVLWPAMLLPWVTPASLNGVGWIGVANLVPFLSGSTLLLILGEATRFLPVAVILTWGFVLRMDKDLVNAARLLSSSWLKPVIKVDVPMVLPGILAGASLVVALTLGELGTAVLLSPPGFETLTIRIYNYLHYGARGHVAVACLAMMLITMLFGYAAKAAFGIKSQGI